MVGMAALKNLEKLASKIRVQIEFSRGGGQTLKNSLDKYE